MFPWQLRATEEENAAAAVAAAAATHSWEVPMRAASNPLTAAAAAATTPSYVMVPYTYTMNPAALTTSIQGLATQQALQRAYLAQNQNLLGGQPLQKPQPLAGDTRKLGEGTPAPAAKRAKKRNQEEEEKEESQFQNSEEEQRAPPEEFPKVAAPKADTPEQKEDREAILRSAFELFCNKQRESLTDEPLHSVIKLAAKWEKLDGNEQELYLSEARKQLHGPTHDETDRLAQMASDVVAKYTREKAHGKSPDDEVDDEELFEDAEEGMDVPHTHDSFGEKLLSALERKTGKAATSKNAEVLKKKAQIRDRESEPVVNNALRQQQQQLLLENRLQAQLMNPLLMADLAAQQQYLAAATAMQQPVMVANQSHLWLPHAQLLAASQRFSNARDAPGEENNQSTQISDTSSTEDGTHRQGKKKPAATLSEEKQQAEEVHEKPAPKKKAKAATQKKPKDKPKRPLSAYNLFFKDERDRLKSEDRQITFQDLGRHIGARWKNLDTEGRAYYDEKAEEQKKIYFEALKKWKQNNLDREEAARVMVSGLPMGSWTHDDKEEQEEVVEKPEQVESSPAPKKKKKSKKKKDAAPASGGPKKPKRPLSAYNLFFREERERIISSDHKCGFEEMARVVGNSWKNIDEATRQEYDQRAIEEKRKYFVAMEDWKTKNVLLSKDEPMEIRGGGGEENMLLQHEDEPVDKKIEEKRESDKCRKCNKRVARRACSQRACLACCDDKHCEAHKDAKEKVLLESAILNGTTDIQRRAAATRKSAVVPGSFREPTFSYLGETSLIWSLRDYMAVPKWRDDAIRRSRKRELRTGDTQKSKSGPKRFKRVMDTLYRDSLGEKAET